MNLVDFVYTHFSLFKLNPNQNGPLKINEVFDSRTTNSQNGTAEEITHIWASLFSFENPVQCLILLRKLANQHLLTILPNQISFLTSLYSDSFSQYDPELRNQASLLIFTLFSTNSKLIPLFDQAGLIQFAYQLFPLFYIPKFLYLYAYESYSCSKFLIANNFISKLVKLLSFDGNISEDETDRFLYIDFDENFLNYILCAGSICYLTEYEEFLFPLGSVLLSLSINPENDWKIRSESIISYSNFLKQSEEACRQFLSTNSLSLLIVPDLINTNLAYKESICMLIDSLLEHFDLLEDDVILKFLDFYLVTLNSMRGEMTIVQGCENCASIIINSISDAAKIPLFNAGSMHCGLTQALFEIFNDSITWNLKNDVFKSLCNLFSFSANEFIGFYVEANFFELFVNYINEMSQRNGHGIMVVLNSIIEKNKINENELFTEILMSNEVDEIIEQLIGSNDEEIKFLARKVYNHIHSLTE